jgi:hypothetical protein
MITFTSHASQKFSMQKDLAMVLLGVIGKTLGERGVITPEEMPHAIERLKLAIKDDTHQAHIKVAELTVKDDEDGEDEPPHLGQRRVAAGTSQRPVGRLRAHQAIPGQGRAELYGWRPAHCVPAVCFWGGQGAG